MFKQRIFGKFLPLCFLVIIFLMVSVPVFSAESKLLGAEVEIWVFPEFDMLLEEWPEGEPNVLTVIRGAVHNRGSQPENEVSVQIPSTATVFQASGPFRVEKGEQQKVMITFDTPLQPQAGREVILEYYDNPISGEVNKEFEFDFTVPFDISNLVVSVKEPLRSSNFITEPSAETSDTDTFGFTSKVHGFRYQNLSAGDKINIKISYTKSDNEPSIKATPMEGQQPGQGEVINPDPATYNPFVLRFTALFLIGLGTIVFYGFRKNRRSLGETDTKLKSKRIKKN